mmetsp:Transcript_16168/g.21402  ORF Transcript_16168/g.21402 Transcript_16168/m.21402 type:complete len:386 (-) Transcript_16168:197-1354(-)
MASLLLFFFMMIFNPYLVRAANENQPHHHNGILTPYKSQRPSIRLSGTQEQKLNIGQMVKMSTRSGDNGRGFVIQDINAPVEIVWDRILDFPNYSKMCPRVNECENYAYQKNFDGSINIKTSMKLSCLGIRAKYFIDHHFDPKQKCLTWTLDYDRQSDIEESVGFWHVDSHPDPNKKNWTRVYYSIDLITPPWFPGPVKQILTNQALGQATSWVKKYSEHQYAESQRQLKLHDNFYQILNMVQINSDLRKYFQPFLHESSNALNLDYFEHSIKHNIISAGNEVKKVLIDMNYLELIKTQNLLEFGNEAIKSAKDVASNINLHKEAILDDLNKNLHNVPAAKSIQLWSTEIASYIGNAHRAADGLRDSFTNSFQNFPNLAKLARTS